jgi:hypothetical protein
MWNPFRSHREHQLKLAHIQAEQSKHLADALVALGQSQTAALAKVGEMVTAQSEGQTRIAGILQSWLDGFKVYEQPVSSTVRDEDEVKMELDRKLSSLPEGVPPELALAWRLHQHDSDLT